MTTPPPIDWPKNPAFAPVPWECRYLGDEGLHPVQIAGYKRMYPGQKLDLMVRMYRTALALNCAGLKGRHPDWTDEQVELAARRGLLHART
jgi:hypothetical protein